VGASHTASSVGFRLKVGREQPLRLALRQVRQRRQRVRRLVHIAHLVPVVVARLRHRCKVYHAQVQLGGIHSHHEMRVYAKPIKSRAPSIGLSDEEQHALRMEAIQQLPEYQRNLAWVESTVRSDSAPQDDQRVIVGGTHLVERVVQGEVR
jgi:hypothetical protein